mmetsp:Transcript_12974/g.24381  ORF Transcript_12974/g.24381 Transcript_12974/m.24381 type:complete len:415 (+) Transcript_12974:128-1372(+)
MTISSTFPTDKTKSNLFTSNNSISRETNIDRLFSNKQSYKFTATKQESPRESEVHEMTEKNDTSVATSDNPTKLFSFVSSRNWPGVIKRSTGDDKKEVSTWIVEKNGDGSTRWRLLPIHKACENKAPSDVIRALIAAYPQSLMMKDTGGNLPLHIACRERNSKAVIAALLSTEPNAAKEQDDEGKLPLHLACRQGVAVQVVDSLIVCHFRAARTADQYGLLPIHWACAQNASLNIVESLLRANPDSVDHKDQWGRTPLSLAEVSTNPEKQAIIETLQKDPSFWTTSLIDEIDTLKNQLENTNNDQYSEKVDGLKKENSILKEKIHELSNFKKSSDEEIDKFSKENSILMDEVFTLKKKLNEFTIIFRSLEEQRKALVQLAGDMENSIQRAVDVAGDDYLEWSESLKIATKSNGA